MKSWKRDLDEVTTIMDCDIVVIRTPYRAEKRELSHAGINYLKIMEGYWGVGGRKKGEMGEMLQRLAFMSDVTGRTGVLQPKPTVKQSTV